MVAGGQYDLVFSLGQACACSLTLRTANLQLASFPLDWLADGTLPSRVDLLIRRFDHWLDRKTHRYFRCPQCRATVRVPKGKGQIRITCPHCKHQFIKKT